MLFAVLTGPVFHVSGFGVSRILGIGFHERMTICYLFRCFSEIVFCQRRIAGNRNFKRFIAVIKYINSDACDTTWNRDAGQVGACIKRTTSNACDTFWNRDACQAAATGKRRFSDACDTTWNRDTCQASAVGKRTFSNFCDIFGNRYFPLTSLSID